MSGLGMNRLCVMIDRQKQDQWHGQERVCGMVEREKQNQWEGLNQNQRQSQEQGCLMVE